MGQGEPFSAAQGMKALICSPGSDFLNSFAFDRTTRARVAPKNTSKEGI